MHIFVPQLVYVQQFIFVFLLTVRSTHIQYSIYSMYQSNICIPISLSVRPSMCWYVRLFISITYPVSLCSYTVLYLNLYLFKSKYLYIHPYQYVLSKENINLTIYPLFYQFSFST
jgi:hypothetical protein